MIMMSSLPLATKKGPSSHFGRSRGVTDLPDRGWKRYARPLSFLRPRTIFYHTPIKGKSKKIESSILLDINFLFDFWIFIYFLCCKYQVISCCKIMVYHQASKNSSQLKSRYWRKPVMDSEFCERGENPIKRYCLVMVTYVWERYCIATTYHNHRGKSTWGREVLVALIC